MDKDILNGNKLIAEFMGFKSSIVHSENGKQYDYDLPKDFVLIKETETTIESNWCEILMERDMCFVEDLIFHKSWDWLIPVVKKIGIIIVENDYNKLYLFQDYNLIHLDIKEIYENVIEFIKWYNE